MSNDDDPFGRRDRTIIRPNPGGRRPPPPSPTGGAPQGGAPPHSAPMPPVAYPPPPQAPPPSRLPAVSICPPEAAQSAPRRGTRSLGRVDERALASSAEPLRSYGRGAADDAPAPVAARVGRPGHGGSQPADARGGFAAPAARQAARVAGARRGGSAHGPGRAGDPAVRGRRSGGRRAGRPGGDRQIRARRHGGRHRAEPAERGQPGLDAVQHARSLLQRAHGRRQVLPGARPRQAESGAQSGPARGDARMPEPRLRGRLSRDGRPGAPCKASAATSTRRSGAPSPRRSKTCRRTGAARPLRLREAGFRSRSWSVAAAAGVILLGTYLVLRNLLSGQAEALALAMAQVHPDTELTIARETAVKPPPDPVTKSSTQLQRIRAALAKEILAGKVDAVQSATTIIHSHRQCRSVSIGRGERQPCVRADRRQDRNLPRQGAGRRSTSTAIRTTDPIHTADLPVQFRTVPGAGEIGRADAEARALSSRAPDSDRQGRRQPGGSE